MKSIMSKHISIPFIISLTIITGLSCTTSNKTAYFNNVSDTTYANSVERSPTVIENNDILSITITSLSPEASSIFNLTNNAGATAGNNRNQSGGYLVGGDGFIQLPIIGRFTATGLTKQQLAENITNTLLEKKLLIDPIVDIRFLNYEVTVLGEVQHPSVITVPNEKISLVKALGLAGDLTIYGRRDNILLIREENGAKKTRHININSSNFITSPYYYLKPNDVVYVEPNKAKAASASLSRQILPSILSGMSLIVLILTRIRY